MYLQYDNEGDLKTQILHGEPCRQGSLLEVSICFSKDDWKTIEESHVGYNSISMLLYLVDDEPINKDLIDENATKRLPVIPYFNGYKTFYKNFDKEKVFSLEDGKEYRMFKFKITLNAEPLLFGVKWLVPRLSFSDGTVEDSSSGEIDNSEIVYEVLGPAQIYIEKTFGNAEEEEVSKSYYEELEKLLSNYGKKLGRGNVVFEGETINLPDESLPQVLEANYAKKLFHEKKNIVFEGETINKPNTENPQTLEANYAKKLIQNSKGNVILEGDTFQDRLNNIYYEKDGFKSEGILFYKSNHEAYPLDANLELNLSPIYVGGVCFVTGFYEFDSTQAPDIYVQEEFLISSDFLSSNATGVFYREIYVRKSTEHPSGYIGVREEATQQGRYYFTAITDATIIGKIRTLIQNLDRNKVSKSQLVEINQNIKNKVDKKTTSGKYVYTHIGEVQGEAKLSDGAEDNVVVQRTVGGYVYVPNIYPQDKFPDVAMGSVAVNKAYVDLGFGLIQASLIGEVQPSEEENGYKQVLTFKGLKGEDGKALTLFTAELSLPKTNLEITEDSSLFKYTFTLKDSKGNTLSTKTIDLPLEELVVDGSYNNVTKSIVLTLKNGNTVDIPVGDLVEGLVNSTDLQNALSNYATLGQVNAKYTKPTNGIPKADLDSGVQSSLGKADTALQEHQDISGKADKTEIPTKVSQLENDKNYLTTETDPTVPAWAKQANKPTYTAEEVGALPSGTQYVSSVNGKSGAITDIATQTEVEKKVDKTSVSESVVANSVVKRTVDGDILVNDDNTAMASKPSNIAVSKGYVQYIMTTLSELFGQNLEAVISSISSSASTDGYTQTLTFKNVNDIGIGTLDIVMPKTNLEITEDSSLFKYTFTLKDSKGNTLSTKTIDLPLEELVVNGSYNNVTKSIVLTLKNGNTVDIPVGDLVEGLVNSTELQNALSNYATLSQVNAKYTKPSTGIPKTDLDSSVQSSLSKADTALQEHQDISGKVDKINGKGLSTNDYTDADKTKLNGLANIKTIGDNLTLDAQGKLSAKVASGVSSINGQTGAVTGIATTEEVNTAKQSANSYTDTKTDTLQSQIDTLNNLYAVGSIYMSTNSTSPASLFGGEWVQITDRFLLGASSITLGANATYKVSTAGTNTDGGEATHVLTVNEMPQHKHGILMSNQGGTSEFACQSLFSGAKGAFNYANYCANNGDSYAHNNMPPYHIVYIWQRTA